MLNFQKGMMCFLKDSCDTNQEFPNKETPANAGEVSENCLKQILFFIQIESV